MTENFSASSEKLINPEDFSAEARVLYDDILNEESNVSHEQYVRLLGLCRRYDVMPEKDFDAFLDIRDPIKFQVMTRELRKLLLGKLKQVAGVPAPEKSEHNSVNSETCDVQGRINALLRPE